MKTPKTDMNVIEGFIEKYGMPETETDIHAKWLRRHGFKMAFQVVKTGKRTFGYIAYWFKDRQRLWYEISDLGVSKEHALNIINGYRTEEESIREQTITWDDIAFVESVADQYVDSLPIKAPQVA